MAQPVQIPLGSDEVVSGLIEAPRGAQACYVLAHGAGAGMSHPFLEAIATELSSRDLATLRFQFPFMERGSKRPDPPAVAQKTVRAAILKAAQLVPGLPLVVGGRSFGGRITSQAQAAAELPGVLGLAFLGFPLHPAKRPSTDRATHLSDVHIPMLFIQGTRDELAYLPDLRSVCEQLSDRVTLKLIEDGDHSFHVRARTGRTDQDVLGEIGNTLATWIKALTPR